MAMKYQALLLIVIILVSVSLIQAGDARPQDAVSQNPVLVGSAKNVAQSLEAQAKTDSQDEMSLTNESQSLVPPPATVQEQETLTPSGEVVAHSFIETKSLPSQECVAVDASIYLVKNISTEEVMFEKNSYNRWPIASVTKLMSALIASQEVDQDNVITITKEMEEAVGVYHSFAEGDRYSVADLLRAMLVFSSNDAAYALADTVGKDAFVSKMNAKAKELGMSQTSFFEPSGLSYLNQSTARDVYLLLRYIHRVEPSILEMTRKQTVTLLERSSGEKKTFKNIDVFAGQKDFLGGKTGYIDESGGNLVTLFGKNGTMYFVAVLGSDDRFADVENLYHCLGQ